jgi:hypothetical protein
MTDSTETQSRRAFRELLASLAEVDDRYLGPDFGVTSERDDADGHRFLMHLLETALHREFEGDADHPEFTKWVTPRRKLLGDNPDAIYFDAPVNPKYTYRVRGNIAGAVYTSVTIDAGTADGGYATRTAGVINDTNFDVAPDGSYEIMLGGPPQERNWIDLPDDAGHLTTRHYFELAEPAGADPLRVVPLTIERIGDSGPPPAPSDESVAAGIRRVNNFVRGNTVERPPRGEQAMPSFVSTVPNVFPKPVVPGDLGLAAFDAAYCAATYVLGPDEALVITGRWPECRFGNVTLWTRYLQTYDYANRPCGRNRANTVLEPDGTFRIVLAHEDPGVPNWLDTEGRPSGQVFWRFFLPEGELEAPQAKVVPFAEVRAAG